MIFEPSSFYKSLYSIIATSWFCFLQTNNHSTPCCVFSVQQATAVMYGKIY